MSPSTLPTTLANDRWDGARPCPRRSVIHILQEVIPGEHSQVLSDSSQPMKASLFCRGNTAGAVMVGSAGTRALASLPKARTEATEESSRPDILVGVVPSFLGEVRKHHEGGGRAN